jgi:hypothetical protein
MWKCVEAFKIGMPGNVTPSKWVRGGNMVYKNYKKI